MFVYEWTLKLFPELRIHVYFRVTQRFAQAPYLFALLCLLTHDRFVALLLLCVCVCALCQSLIIFPHRGIHHLYQAEKRKLQAHQS